MDDALHHLCLKCRCEYRSRRISPHTAGIGTGIAIADPLVVLRGTERHDILAVADRKEAHLFAGHKFLDDHLGTGIAKPPAEHMFDRVARFSLGFGDDHALAGGEAIGLDDNRQAKTGKVCEGRSLVLVARIGGGGDVFPCAQILHKAL